MQLFGLPSLIAGIILLTAGKHWFSGAGTVGLILIIASVLVIAFIVLIVWLQASPTYSATRRRRP